MRLHLDQIKDNRLTLEFEEEPARFSTLAEMAEEGECSFAGPVKTVLHLQRVGGMIEVEGKVKTRIGLSCGRCLQSFEAPLEATFTATYVEELPRVEAGEGEGGEEVELTAEEMGLTLVEGEEIDLGELVQEQVVMGIPYHPLCAEKCRGLCPRCGADLNKGDCGCAPEEFNNRFAALKGFKVDKS